MNNYLIHHSQNEYMETRLDHLGLVPGCELESWHYTPLNKISMKLGVMNIAFSVRAIIAIVVQAESSEY